MVYLRKKTIHGNDYWYLCKSMRVDEQVKQKVIKYIGPCKNIGPREAEERKISVMDRLKDE